MKKVLFIFLIFCFSLNIISCSSSSDEDDIEEITTTTDNTTTTTDTTAPVIAEVTAVTTPTTDSTPDYTFSSDEAGTITYGGSCSSSSTSATTGDNTITLVSLSDGTYSNCTIIVNDSAGNASSALSVSTFVVDTTAPSVSSFTLSDTALITGDNATVTLVFSEAVASFSSSADITVANGTLAVMTSTDNITWAGTFTPTANTEDDNNTLSLATSYTDTAGNTGPAATTLNYVVDTTAPTVSSISTTADNQSSVSITDNFTVTFSEAMEPSYVTTSTSDTNCAGSIRVSSDNYSTCVKMSSEPVSSNSNRTFTLDPYDNLTVGSTYLTRITTGVKDTAGNAMSSQYDNSTGFAIVDLTAPTVSSVSTTADNQSSVAITDNITVTFSEAMDNTSITTNTDNSSCYGTLGVSSDNFSNCVQMSSTPASSNDNKTFTLDPSDNLTGGTTYLTRVTTGVKDAAGNEMISQYVTSSGFTTVTGGWQLIARQVDSDNFTDGTHELFSSNARSTFLQNENDNSSSTFMSIGKMNKSYYTDNGTYKFKLVWGGGQVDSLDNKSVTWTQTSWLDNSTTQGFQEIGTSGYVNNSSSGFRGLAKSTSTSCVIDGDGGSHNNWFNCVGVIGRWNGAMPGPLEKTASSMNLYIWAPEIKETNYALDFDGTEDYVAADGVTSNLDSSTGLPFTVSAWAYPDTTNNEAIWAFNKTGNNDENLNLLFYARGGSTKKFYHYDRGSSSWTLSTNTFETGEWHHIVVVVDSSGNGKLYVNGGEEGTWSNGTNTSADRFSIGQEYDGSGSTASDFFDGKIDEVAVWNVALSAADVTALYNSGIGLKASANSGNYDNSGDLVGYWKFNEGTGSTLTDNTSNSNNGTLTNMDSSDWVTSGSKTKPSFQ